MLRKNLTTSSLEEKLQDDLRLKNRSKHFYISGALLLATAVADTYLTVKGFNGPVINGDSSYEGAFIMRHWIEFLGPIAGIIAGKTTAAMVVYGFSEILRRTKPSTLAKSHLITQAKVEKHRGWLNYVPQYAMSAAQGVAASQWAYLLFVYTP